MLASQPSMAPLPHVGLSVCTTDGPHSRFAPVISFIEENLAERLSIEDLAAGIDLSPYHFVRLFKQELGLTPHQYVISRRVERAREMLDDQLLPIAAIALDTGFASQSHLTELFRRRFGMTPAVYRARCDGAQGMTG